MPDVRRLRCAIYTRVSTDAGLEQEFNSLDAQREAAEAFIKSQAREGWTLIPTAYNDGGFSGGSLERPALQQLLADIRVRKIDVVLVYKVDRLTRSLADFAKLVELFDAHGVSFVSVTQAFNTTNSMGRLTLNVLLSFAQFEREVTAERIRDKVAASKKKGVWMGGALPLGYRVENRKLLIVETEAVTVRMIFRRYLELGSIIALLEDLRHKGIKTKVRPFGGKTIGGIPFTAGPLTYLLKNRIYVGDIVHKDQSYPGEHAPLLDRKMFDAVQAKLRANNVAANRKSGSSNAALMGKIFDDRGNVMTPRHAHKGARRYLYYVSRAFVEGRKADAGSISRVAANDIEPTIAAALEYRRRPGAGGDLSDDPRQRALLEQHVARVTVGKDRLEIFLKGAEENADPISVAWRRRPSRPKRVIILQDREKDDARPMKTKTRKLLLRSIARGRLWLEQLVSGQVMDVYAIASREGCSARSVNMTLGLAFLEPAIVMSAIAGELPKSLGSTALYNLPPVWQVQRSALGI